MNGLLQQCLAPVLSRNRQFQNRHTGDTCYIFGNGASLKSMDLAAFTDHPAIGVNFLCLHKDFRALDLRYYVVPEAFFFYPIRLNAYNARYQTNIFGRLFKRTFLAEHGDIPLFTSASNVFGAVPGNIYYLHHFGHRRPDRAHCDITGAFSFMTGGLYAAVGVAINLGFRKAILVGCDYTFSPTKNGYFYSAGVMPPSNNFTNVYESLIRECIGTIELEVITDSGVSSWFPSREYTPFTGRPLVYRENVELVAAETLTVLQHASDLGWYTLQVYPDAVGAS